VQWVADRVWWIGGTAAACFALAVAAGMWLERLADRRGTRFAAAHGILSRADMVLPAPARTVAGEPARPALPVPQVININFFSVPSSEQAEVIRQALPGHEPAGYAGGLTASNPARRDPTATISAQRDPRPPR
jgi:hypothetical protein